LNPHVRKNTNT